MKQLYNLIKCFRQFPEYATSNKLNINFIKNLDKISVFIIEKNIDINQLNNETKQQQMKEAIDKGIIPLNAPFEMCWFEGFEIPGFKVPSPDFNYEEKPGALVGFGIHEYTPEYQAIHLYFEHKLQQKIVGNKVHIYQYFTHHTFSIQQGKIGLQDDRYYELFLGTYMIIQALIMPLIKRENIIFTEPKEEIRFKQRIEGQYVNIKSKPKNYLYIAGTKTFAESHPTVRTINKADHQYEVMGHWRRLLNPEALGKDRKGQRTTKGFTWIVPFIKGPKDAPLIKKVRKIK